MAGGASPIGQEADAGEFAAGVLWCQAGEQRQEILLGVEEAAVVDLPPLPPAGVFDARVEIGNGATAWQVPLAATPARRLQIQGELTQLGWQMPPEDEGLWHLAVDGNIIDLRGRGGLTLDSRAGDVFLVQTRPAARPLHYILEQNFPNPFNSSTVIRFNLPAKREVELAVYNLAGQKVATLAAGVRPSGSHSFHWSGRDERGRKLSSGVYLYRLRVGTHMEVRKMAFLQ